MGVHGTNIAVVVLNHDGGDYLLRSVRSVLEQSIQCELLVVDNGSTDRSLERLRAEAPNVPVLELDRNLGYAQGMNAGIQAVGAAVVVPLNVDAVLAPDFAASALDVLEEYPSAGVVAPLVVRNEPGPVDWTRGQWRLDSGPQHLSRDLRVVAAPPPASGTWCMKANGACPVLRRSAINEVIQRYGVGPFDPVYDTYGEDVDLAFKLDRLGWRTRYAPEVLAAHTTSAATAVSITDKRGRLRTNLVAGRHRNAWRHLPTRALVVTWPLVVMGDVALAVRQALRGDLTGIGDVWRAWCRVAREAAGLSTHRRAHPPRVSAHLPRGPSRRRELNVTLPGRAAGAA